MGIKHFSKHNQSLKLLTSAPLDKDWKLNESIFGEFQFLDSKNLQPFHPPNWIINWKSYFRSVRIIKFNLILFENGINRFLFSFEQHYLVLLKYKRQGQHWSNWLLIRFLFKIFSYSEFIEAIYQRDVERSSLTKKAEFVKQHFDLNVVYALHWNGPLRFT